MKYKQEIIKKKRDEVKKGKIIAKEEVKKEKLIAKEEVKKGKIIAKEEKKNLKINTENEVLGPAIIIDMLGNEIYVGCISILKYGINKGQYCGNKIISENICSRHLKIKHKIILNENKL